MPTTGLQPVLKPFLSQHLHAVISFSELCKFYISAVTPAAVSKSASETLQTSLGRLNRT